jgi:hypothetical protein
MHVRTFTLAVAIAVALAAPAGARQSLPLQDEQASGTPQAPAVPAWGHVPSAADVQKANAAENPAVRSAAQSVYSQLVAGRLDRSRLTQDVNKALSNSATRTLSQRLGELGTPSWMFVENTQTSAGWVSIYRLKYAQGSTYMRFGVGDDGVVYALALTNVAPAGSLPAARP